MFVLRKIFRHPAWLLIVVVILAALVPTLPLLHSDARLAAHASSARVGPVIPHRKVYPKPRAHRISKGANRSQVPTLATLAMQPRRAAGGQQGALIGANVKANATTLFFDNFESGAPGWTTVGDNQITSYYPNGHDFWNLVQNPNTISVPNTVNPGLVSYPDSSGSLPSAYSGTYAWWYGDNPAVDTQNPSGASATYMGNQNDWPVETNGNGGTSNGPDSASLISPSIDLTSAPDATLTFATWWEIESVNPAHFDMMYVDVSKDGGTSWASLGVLNPSQSPAGGQDAYPYTNNGLDVPASWQVASVDLTPYVGAKVQLRFRFDSIDQFDNGFRGWLVDDVGVYSTPAGSPLVSNVTPDAGTAGDTVTITGSGFGAQQNSSTVTFNGMAASVQSWSNTSITTTVPPGTTSGQLVVTVNGSATASVQFTITASINLSSSTSSPETVNAVSGWGFAANEPVSIYINGVNGTLLASANADANGNLPSTNVTLQDMPLGNYLILAEGQTSHISAGATLSIIPSLSTSVSKVKPGQTITLTGLGFATYESVQVQLNTTSGSTLGYLSCDGNGTCTGSATMPNYSVLAGLDILIGSGTTSGMIAEYPITFIPAITLSPVQGGPGTYLSLSGAAFAANETVQVYWGTTSGISEGTSTTDAYGNLNFSFNAPTGLAVGNYSVTVARTKQKPATVTATFRIIPPQMVSTPAGILNGQSVYVQLSGFQSDEQVTMSWNANGGQQVTTFNVGSDGSVSTNFVPPSAPKGSYTLTATGGSSGLQATSSLTIGPGIVLSPNSTNPGNTITVSGGGFSANEALDVYFQLKTNGVTSVTTDATGSFNVSLTVPSKYKSTTSYYVFAVSTTNTEQAKAQFYFITPYVSTYSYAYYGTTTTISGGGFLSNEPVNVYWDYQDASQVKVGQVVTASDGTFSLNITVPSEPDLGTVAVAAIGGTSHFKTTTSIFEIQNIVLTPSSGPAGTTVHVKGGAFSSGEVVTISYQGTTLGTATAASNGSFGNFSFVVPTTTAIGYTYVQAVGGTTGNTASATFIVTPKLTISPKTGTSGATITVTGKSFSPSNVVYLYWYDPGTGNSVYLGTFSTSANGTFKTTIAAPSGLISGNTYYVQGYDSYTGIVAQAAFVAQ